MNLFDLALSLWWLILVDTFSRVSIALVLPCRALWYDVSYCLVLCCFVLHRLVLHSLVLCSLVLCSSCFVLCLSYVCLVLTTLLSILSCLHFNDGVQRR
jgi:hypothetical protein